MLHIENLCASYGGPDVLKHVSLDVTGGETLTVLGANTAGKTTLLRAISGLVRCHTGSIAFDGMPLLGLAAHEIPVLGIGHVPEGRRVFPDMSIFDNLMMGAYLAREKADLRARLDGVLTLFPRLGERQRQLAGSLSGGEQQMLAIGRALMGDPRLLLLDEPSTGLAPKACQDLCGSIREINKRGVAVLLVEQNAALSLSLAHRACVLEHGRVILSGDADAISRDTGVRHAYLGV